VPFRGKRKNEPQLVPRHPCEPQSHETIRPKKISMVDPAYATRTNRSGHLCVSSIGEVRLCQLLFKARNETDL
jgi:hypothetical protein